MKSSKFVADANMDIRIERGLKILQFAGEYNLRRAYYRNCPINTFQDAGAVSSKVRAGVMEQHTSHGDLLIDLNEEIKTWGKEAVSPQKNIIKEEKSIKSIKVDKSAVSPQLSREQEKPIHKQKDNDEDGSNQESLDDLSNYESQATKKRLQSIAEDPAQAVSMSKSQNLNAPSIINKNSHSQIVKANDRSNISIHSSHSAQSAHSKKSRRQKVEQVHVTQQSIKIMKNKKMSEGDVSGSNIQEKIHRSIKEEPVVRKKSDQIQNASKVSSSEKYSFLDRSISRIVSNSSQLKSKQTLNQSNITDFSLMRQLSASFQDEQNMRMLLKLQNCELEQGYLERRIVNRLEKGYKQVSSIKDITWQSLKLPKMNPGFIRPNYAHVIE